MISADNDVCITNRVLSIHQHIGQPDCQLINQGAIYYVAKIDNTRHRIITG